MHVTGGLTRTLASLVTLGSLLAVTTKAAWRSKPSWMLVAGADRTIHPDLERWYAKRTGSHTVEVAGASHVVYIRNPRRSQHSSRRLLEV
jgi:pimeloyl-ACP methyl ester carboxylesterase